ncbi:MAG TPA: hypothetical protein VH208_14165, partial [Myxococcaceae bacterium]|nr:hypothetical protein [Myxococcaceae bacterium]
MNLEQLTDSQREALDVENAGEVSQRDVASAVSLFHGGSDGMLSADESRRLDEFLGAERGWSRHPIDADYLHQHLAERAGGLERALAVSDAAARERFVAARAAMGSTPAPDWGESTPALEAQLASARKALDSLPQRQAASRAGGARVEQLGQSLHAGEIALSSKR